MLIRVRVFLWKETFTKKKKQIYFLSLSTNLSKDKCREETVSEFILEN